MTKALKLPLVLFIFGTHSIASEEVGIGVKFPPVVKVGESSNRVLEVQRTLNHRVKRFIELPNDWHVGATGSHRKGMRVVVTPSMKFRIRGEWTPFIQNEDIELPDGKSNDQLDKENRYVDDMESGGSWLRKPKAGEILVLSLPDEKLHPAGIYGEQTFALIVLFQLSNELEPTGLLDADTLRRLEPLIPSSAPLDQLPYCESGPLGLIMQQVEDFVSQGVSQDNVEKTSEKKPEKKSKRKSDRKLTVKLVSAIIATGCLVIFSLLGYVASKWLFQTLGERKSKSQWIAAIIRLLPRRNSSLLLEASKDKSFFAGLALVVSAVVFYCGVLLVFPMPIDNWGQESAGTSEGHVTAYTYLTTYEDLGDWLSRIGLAYISVSLTLVALTCVNASEAILRRLRDGDAAHGSEQPDNDPLEEQSNDDAMGVDDGMDESATAISGIVRFVWRVVFAIGMLLIISSLAGQNPLLLAGGLGAFMAVVLLVFRDTILGLVAAIQILAHKLVRVGDWIEVPKFNADGDVIKVSLTTIQIRNFDKTITSIPTYSLVSETFRNWQAMCKSGGRRIKRSLNIDLKTVKPVDSELCERFETMSLLTNYIRGKRRELSDFFENHNVSISVVNGRWLTNLGTFRVYIENYLKQHSELHSDMTCLVRQLQPTRQGMPLEIYAFTNVVEWRDYERIQADIFDHIVSILPEFDLRLFQDPSEFNYTQADQLFSHRIDDQALITVEEELVDPGMKDLQDKINQLNRHLEEHPRASADVAVRKAKKAVKSSAMENITVSCDDRVITLVKLAP